VTLGGARRRAAATRSIERYGARRASGALGEFFMRESGGKP
jgi:hypothetical protein